MGAMDNWRRRFGSYPARHSDTVPFVRGPENFSQPRFLDGNHNVVDVEVERWEQQERPDLILNSRDSGVNQR